MWPPNGGDLATENDTNDKERKLQILVKLTLGEMNNSREMHPTALSNYKSPGQNAYEYSSQLILFVSD
jgi:hypothetical protein